MKCLNCEKELEQIPKKRQKQFCNSTCRSNFWQKSNRIQKPEILNKAFDGVKLNKEAFDEVGMWESAPDNKHTEKVSIFRNKVIQNYDTSEPPIFKNDIERKFWEEKQKLKK